jgi:hypothetical protein
MNDKMKGFIELAQQDFAQAMELMAYMPGAKEAILKHTHPKANPQHRRFFLDAAKDVNTDPEILHLIGKRDLPTKIRFAVIDNPSTKRETIEKMARQTATDAVRFRAQKFLETNSEPPEGDIMESKFKLSTKDIRQIIMEEVKSVMENLGKYSSYSPDHEGPDVKFEKHPIYIFAERIMDEVLKQKEILNQPHNSYKIKDSMKQLHEIAYYPIIDAFKKFSRLIFFARANSDGKTDRQQQISELTDSMYEYEKNPSAQSFNALLNNIKNIERNFRPQNTIAIDDEDEEMPF